MNVEGRRVIVTGGSSGIGRATAKSLLSNGALVATFDVSPMDQDFGLDPHWRHWIVDVTSDQQVGTAAAEASDWLGGTIDVLIHAAGIMRAQQAAIDDVSIADWDQVIAVNLRGAFLAAKHAVRFMAPVGGAVILVSSVAGVFVGSGSIPYGASKGGVHGLALTLEERLAVRGIRVNEVSPGSVDTPLLRSSLDEAARRMGNSALKDEVMSRWITPEQVAGILVFLASREADVVRGTVRTR